MTSVQIVPSDGGGWTATVAGVSMPVDSFAAEPAPNGRMIVSLAVYADSLQIGSRPDLDQTRRIERPRNEPPVTAWGDPNTVDPRANIPGWQPPPIAADAARSRTGEYPPVSHRRAQ